MHRSQLLDLLAHYGRAHPGESVTVEKFEEFVRERPDCFLRSCAPGHVTASAWLLSADHQSYLLTHHRKLDRWLQVGGHADGEPEVWRAALREAQEESGLVDLRFVGNSADIRALDIDIHEIPARHDEPAHLHYDVRFLLEAAGDQTLQVSDESHDLRWFPMADFESMLHEESLLRMARKVRDLVS